MDRQRVKAVFILLLTLTLGSGGLAQAQTHLSQQVERVGGRLTLAFGETVAHDLDLVGELSISQEMEKARICPGSGVCTSELWDALVELEETAGGITEKTKHDTAMNAIRNMKAIAAELDTTLGSGGGDLDGDGYPDLLKTYQPGQPVYGNITLKRKFTGDRTLLTWYQQAASGRTDRKSGSIIYLDREGNEALRVNLFECWPVRYTLSFDNGLVEEIEIAVERIERAALAITVNEEGLPAAQAPVRLEAGEALVGRFQSVTPISGSLRWNNDGADDDCDGVTGACPSERPVRCQNGACVAGLVAALNGLEQQVAAVAEKARHDTAKNAIGNIRGLVDDVDDGLTGLYLPGKASWADLRLSRPLSRAYSAGVWFTSGQRGPLTLRYLGSDGKPVVALDLGEAWPIAYTVHLADGQLVEEVVLRPIRMELR